MAEMVAAPVKLSAGWHCWGRTLLNTRDMSMCTVTHVTFTQCYACHSHTISHMWHCVNVTCVTFTQCHMCDSHTVTHVTFTQCHACDIHTQLRMWQSHSEIHNDKHRLSADTHCHCLPRHQMTFLSSSYVSSLTTDQLRNNSVSATHWIRYSVL